MSRRWRSGSVAVGALACLALVVAAVAVEAVAGAPREALFEGGSRPLAVGPVPAGTTGIDAAACATCHVDIAAEWRASLHRESWSNAVFQAAYAHESLAFCRNCHAPLHRGPVPTGVAASEGISCAVCHVREGTVLGTGRIAAPHEVVPHPVRVEPRLADSRYCAECHEFGFISGGGPRGHRIETKELQQSTFSEWSARYEKGVTKESCIDCHMPWRANAGDEGGGKHRDHTFGARRDPVALASAVKVAVSAVRAGAGVRVSATLTPGAVGHGFPTGDLFRRLELTVWPAAAPTQTARIVYERRFGQRDGKPKTGSERYETADTRVGEDATPTRTVDLVMPPGVTGATETGAREQPERDQIAWRLEYLLMPRELARRHKIDARENVTVIGEGLVPVTP